MTNKMSSTNRGALVAFNVVLMFTTIFLNLLSVVAIRNSSQLKSRMCYYVILVQATVDLGIGVLSIPLFLVYVTAPYLGIENCFVIVCIVLLINMINILSIFTLTLITIERYIGVLHPYSYQYFVTKRHVLYYGAVASSVSFTCVMTANFAFEATRYYLPLVLLILLLFTVYAYTRIFIVVRKLDLSRVRPGVMEQEQGGKRRLLRKIKHAKSCFVVVLCFALCYSPTGIVLILEVITNETLLYVSYWYWTTTLIFLNANFNSIIFFWNTNMLRVEGISVLKSFILVTA